MTDRGAPPPEACDRPASLRRKVSESAVTFLAYAGLTLWSTWPLFAQPGSTLLDANHPWLAAWFAAGFVPAIERDVGLLVWLFAWDWHALTTSPAELFNANIFHPVREALAYSEHGLGHLAVTAPIRLFSDNAVLAHQLNLFLMFPLSGLGTFLLLRHWRIGFYPAFVGGLVYAFCPARLDMMYHAHLLAGQYFVLVLLFLDRTLERARLFDAAALSLFLCIGLHCSYYLAYMTSIGVLVAGVLMLGSLAREQSVRRGAVLAAVAGMVAASVFALVSRPYLRVKLSGAIEEYSGLAPQLSLLSNDPWRNYLYPPALLESGAVDLAKGGHAYLGLLPLLLVACAYLPGRGGDSPRRRGRLVGVGLAAVGYILALGPVAQFANHAVSLPYAWAMAVIPGFSSMRVPSRFSLVLMAGVAILVGYGSAEVERRLRRFTRSRLVPAASCLLIVVVVGFEYDLARLGFAARPAIASPSSLQVARLLATLPPGPVLEVPFDGEGRDGLGQSMILSTWHWKPLLNGSSGYVPFSVPVVRSLTRLLPDPDALKLLERMTGVRYFVVRSATMRPGALQRWLAAPGLKRVAIFGPDLLFETSARPAPDLVDALRACSRDRGACTELQTMVSDLEKPVRRPAG